jgi:hypothetical protein
MLQSPGLSTGSPNTSTKHQTAREEGRDSPFPFRKFLRVCLYPIAIRPDLTTSANLELMDADSLEDLDFRAVVGAIFVDGREV